MSDQSPCTFCGKPVGDDCIYDENGEVACKPCGEAEIQAQKTEALKAARDTRREMIKR